MFEIFLWKSSAVVKLQVYQIRSAGSQVFSIFLKHLF